jgi:uncharacterized protein (DUF1330 family)
MAAYLLIRVDVHDWERYRAYMQATPAALAKYGGKFIARGGETVTLEGPEETRRVALVEFPSLAQAKAFYASPEYEAAKALRAGACDAQFVAIEGLE